MKVKCISYDTKGLTFGKEYNVIKKGSNFIEITKNRDYKLSNLNIFL